MTTAVASSNLGHSGESVSARPSRAKLVRTCIALAVICIVAYETTSYGGIRSPDSEIVYRSAESLVSGKGLEIQQGLEGWQGFGVAEGLDGGLYSIFGPGQALVAAPLVAAGQHLAHVGAFDRIRQPLPVSHAVGNGLKDFTTGSVVVDRREHGERWVASRLNVIVSALGVVMFYLISLRISNRPGTPMVTTLIYGFGTLTWPYAGTFFSEPLATLFVLAAFCALLRNDPHFGARRPDSRKPAIAGLLLGMATATHLTAILFVPFFFAYAVYPYLGFRNRHRLAGPVGGFAYGIAVPLALLGYYNFVRFGSLLETGRTASAAAAVAFGYGTFTNPLVGLYGLLMGPHKSLILFCPVIVLSALGWPRFRRMHPFLADTLAAMIVARILFIASRSDWHGGFSLGPRYLIMIVPFLCLSLIPLISDVLHYGRRRWSVFVACVWLLVSQQLYFSAGEAFTHYHTRRIAAAAQGIDIFAGERIYLEWFTTPLATLHKGYLGSFRLSQLSLDTGTLVLLGCTLLAVLAFVIVRLTPSHVFGTPKDGA